jgi:hypothetical protein
MNKKEKNVVLSVRGENADQCCVGLMTVSDNTSESMACPHAAKAGAKKTEVKKI